MREQAFIRPMLLMLAGLVIWAVHFTVIYGFNALVCARGLAGETVGGFGLVEFSIGVATLAAILLLALSAVLALSTRSRPQPDPEATHTRTFMRALSLTLVGLALVAIIWQALPAFIVPACA